MSTEIYMTILKGNDRLVITGNMSLFKDFVTTFTQDEGGALAAPVSTVYNPGPQTGDTDKRS